MSNIVASAASARRGLLKKAIRARDLWFINASGSKELRAARKDPAHGVPLRGKRVLITGASSGIGAAAAHRFGALGAHVILVARRREDLEAAAGKIRAGGGLADFFVCDLNDLDAVDRLAEEVTAEHGGVDVLINNAGRSIRRPIEESLDRWHDYERVMRLNFFSALRLIRGLLPSMLAHGGGHVINVASLAVPNDVAPYFSAYGASKAALSIVGRNLGFELRRKGVSNTTLYYPLVRTEMIAPTEEYDRIAALTPEEAAEWMVLAARVRPIRILPRYSKAVALFNVFSPKRVDWFYRHGGIEF